MKPYEVKSAIKRDGLGSLYLVLGEEEYLRDQAVADILAGLTEQVNGRDSQGQGNSWAGEGEFLPCDRLYGDETNALEILSRVQEVPIFSSHAVVVVKWGDKLTTREGEALIPYFREPSGLATLVFVAGKLDGRLKWVQALKTHSTLIECAPLYDNQCVPWIKGEAGRLGMRLSHDAVQGLKERVGEGLYGLHAELEKLAAYVPKGREVTPHDVEAVRGAEPGTSVFELAGAIGSRNRGQALSILTKNLEVGEAPLRILGALMWQYRRIWRAKEELAKGVGEAKIAKLIGIPPFKQRDFFGVVRRFSQPHLRRAFQLFLRTDSALKGGRAGAPARILEILILELSEEVEGKWVSIT